MKRFRIILVVLLLLFLTACIPQKPTPEQVFASSEDYVTAAWDAFNQKDYPKAISLAQECIDKWEEDANDQQKEIKKAPPTGKVSDEERTAVFRNWAVNDVGTAYFIIGESSSKSGKNAEAIDAFKKARSFKYARCWDQKGYFWSPAEEAEKRLARLQ